MSSLLKTRSSLDDLHPEARKGFELFNQGDYYQAHEPLELAWMETPSPERDLYQGILQLGLAYYQITRGNYRGAIKMFQRGHKNLIPLGKSLGGVDIMQLRADVQRVEDQIRELGSKRIKELTRTKFNPLPLIDQGNKL